MTVLVLDNPELLARAAALASLPQDLQNSGNDARPPQRHRFHYGFNSHQLCCADHATLLEHAAFLKRNPQAVVIIHGHSDGFGTSEFNRFLSRQRATVAARVLKQDGVAESQIQVKAWGDEKPLARPEDHAANRRIELTYEDLSRTAEAL